jgi:hypothetical protein
MNQLTPEDRSVMFALQQSESALSIRTLTQLTGVTTGRVAEALKRLKSKESVELVARFGEICYLPVGDTEAPLLVNFGAWLDLYCSRLAPIEKGDSEALTFASCGVVILSSALTDSGDARFLARLTTFPEGFVKLVLEIIDGCNLWFSPGMCALIQTFEDWAQELTEVDESFQSATEEFWNASTSLDLNAELDTLRAGHRYGGRDQWLDAPEADSWQDWRPSESRSDWN